MVKRLTFNDPPGYLTVTDGDRKWIISKEEAGNISVSADEPRQVGRGLGTLVLSFLAFLPVESSKKLKYEVKIITESNEEVELYSGEDVNQAYDIVNRIADFTDEGTKEEVYHKAVSADSQKLEKNTGLMVAGIFEIISSPFVGGTLLYVYYGLHYEGFYEISLGFRHIFLLSIIAIFTLLPLIGGICALKRRHWLLALIGSIVSFIFWLLGIPALVLLALNRSEFK